MDENREQEESIEEQARKTLAYILCPIKSAVNQLDMEEFRKQFERLHGPTDLTKHYTSMWPEEQKRQLMELDFEAYMHGLPPYAHAYFAKATLEMAQDGQMDDLSDPMLEYFARRRSGRNVSRRSGPPRNLLGPDYN